jgi:hypothetical protein
MKPEIYYENKNEQILNLAAMLNLQIPRAAANGGRDLEILRQRVLDFISLTPDASDSYTDDTFVACWKASYNRISEAIRDIKEIGDYRLDAKRRDLGKVANALLASRRAVFWL